MPVFSGMSHAEEIASVENNEAVTETADKTDLSPITKDSDDSKETAGPAEVAETKTTIETGDAEAILENENIINTSVTELETESTTPETKQEETVSSTDPILTPGETPLILHNQDTTQTVEADNEATSTTGAIVSAETGSNNGSGSTVTINTGDAVAYTNVINVVNTNIVNSDGLLTFINETLGYENFDLRDTFDDIYTAPETANSTTPCSLESCSGGSAELTVHSTNTAQISNDITVTADTGSNNATGSTASIITGDAYAAANVVNVANTNITDSNYLLLVFNNFDDYGGNLVMPSSSFFENQFNGGNSYKDININITNSATVTNNVGVTADTGGNSANPGGTITTGSATAVGTVQNTLNTNLFGGNAFTMLIRVHGDWDGEIFGLPDGMTWAQTDQGIQLVYNGGSMGGSEPFNDLSVNNTNSANITNNVSVFALTGNNATAGGTATVDTGDAYAAANVLTLANTNIVGQNWANLIFNIYGNWNGNISFGVPDLWIGAEAYAERDPIMPGSEVTYTFTIKNNGDTDAPNVVLTNSILPAHLHFVDPERTSQTQTHTQGHWDLGTIPAGETREVVVTTKTDSLLPRGSHTNIPLWAEVRSTTPDADDTDNTEYIEITTGKLPSPGSETKRSFPANYTIEKTANHDTIVPGETVDYSVSFFSRGGPLYEALLVDILEDEHGTIIQEQSWPLGTIETWETITIDYSVVFNPDTATGTYTNRAQLLGLHESRRRKYQNLYESPFALHTLTIQDGLAGQVLGASASCEQYIHEFMQTGNTNTTSEVVRLQTFLNVFESAHLPITGYFGAQTEIAVRAFQKKYADDILTPWGMSGASGYVYLTTRKKMNELYCANTRLFPLSSSEEAEIARYIKHLQQGTQTTQPKPQPPAPEQETSILPKESVGEPEEILTPPSSIRREIQKTKEHSSFMEKIRLRFGNWFSAVAKAANN